MERNRVLVEVKEKAERNKAYAAVERTIARNLASWQDWNDHGYAAAFDEAWKCGMRDVDSIVTYVLSVGGTKGKVNRTI
jgi:hypothetical protein